MKMKSKKDGAKQKQKKGLEEIFPELKPFQLPPRAHVSKAEFLERLRNISEWRKKRLAELRTQSPR
jgi:hypothetical protein